METIYLLSDSCLMNTRVDPRGTPAHAVDVTTFSRLVDVPGPELIHTKKLYRHRLTLCSEGSRCLVEGSFIMNILTCK